MNIGSLGNLAAHQLLRSRILGRSRRNHLSGYDGNIRSGPCREQGILGKAEINQHHLPVRPAHDILGLEIPMDNARKMKRVHTCANSQHEVGNAFLVRRNLDRLQQFQNEVGPSVRFATLEKPRKLRQPILNEKIDLVLETPFRRFIRPNQYFGRRRYP